MFKNIISKFKDASNQSGIGGLGEDYAAKFLQKNGYKIIQRNWYNEKGKRMGEIDIVAKQGETIVFVEVKSRDIGSEIHSDEVNPQENITAFKLHKLGRIAELYISQNELWDTSWRIDGITVVFTDGQEPKVQHIESIFL